MLYGGPRSLEGKSKLIFVDSGAGDVLAYYAHVSSRWPLPFPSKSDWLREGGQFTAAADCGSPCLLSDSVSVSLLKRGRNFVEVAARHGAIPERVVTVEAVRLRLEYA